MIRWWFAAVGVAAVVVTSVAGPAGAAAKPPPDVGIVHGLAAVGKTGGTCSKLGPNSMPSGSGLGFPLLSKPKNAYYWLSTGFGPIGAGVYSLTQLLASGAANIGTIELCGKLNPTVSNIPVANTGLQQLCLRDLVHWAKSSKCTNAVPSPPQIRVHRKYGLGASCGLSKGFDGVGKIAFQMTGDTVYLNNVGWKLSASGVLPVVGEAAIIATKGTGPGKSAAPGALLLAPTLAFGGTDCLELKRDNLDTPKKTGTEGANVFMVMTVYAITPVDYVNMNLLPLFCKTGGSAGGESCLYQPKKG